MTLHSRTPSRLTVLLALPALLLAVTACSAAPGSGTHAGSSPEASPSARGSDRDAWSLKYAQCLRENGIDAPDPTSGGQGAAIQMDDAYLAAAKACEEKLGSPPPLTADEKEQLQKESQQAMLKAAKCYRDNGIDVPDPAAGQVPQIPADVPRELIETCGLGPGSITSFVGS